MDFDQMHFSKDHEWIKPTGGADDEVLIGITEYAAGELGDIVFIELPEVGAEFKQGDTLGTIEAVKTVADLYSPVSGTVVEVNGKLEDEPEVVNAGPYGDGWFLKMKMRDPSEVKQLMSHDAYQEMVGEA
jgi:glycine cleavage system H protein